MSLEFKYELVLAECTSLRQQLKEAYSKCTAIYEALTTLDEYSNKERTQLEELVLDLKQTIEKQLKQNLKLSMENVQYEKTEKLLQKELNNSEKDLKTIMIKYRRIYINQQQEKYIENHRIISTNKK